MQQFAEEVILKAQKEGEFDNLEGRGRPLRLEDDSMVPEDCRMAYKLLKNSGHVPPELEEQKDILNIKDMLAHCKDEQERYRQIQKLNLMVTRMNMQRRRPVHLEEDQVYYQRAVERISLADPPAGSAKKPSP
jgi:hypothetical protein